MADRDMTIPMGPDLTNGEGFEPIPAEGQLTESTQVPSVQVPGAQTLAGAQPLPGAQPLAGTQPLAGAQYDAGNAYGSQAAPAVQDSGSELNAQGLAALDALNVPVAGQDNLVDAADGETNTESFINYPDEPEDTYNAGGLTDEEIAEQGMDEMQMSILALKDSIGQGRELKAREKEREELAEALELDHEELADRENILANYQSLVAEQDAIINQCTQEREARKAELSQTNAQLDETEEALDRMRAYHEQQLQPIEGELGRVKALADRAKNDERSRKSELNSAEAELRRADDSDPNTMALALHRQAQEDYEQARKTSERAKEQLAEVQRSYDDAKSQIEQAEAPMQRSIEELNTRIEQLKETINDLGEKISVATKRRQYCDNVFRYPDETAKMRVEVESAEEAARQMDAENDALRARLETSKKKAMKAKIAIGIIIAIVVVFIITLVVVTNR